MEAISLVKDFGFPIFVCAWFMWRTEKRLDKIAQRLSDLVSVQSLIAKSLDLNIVERKLLEES